MELDTGSAVSIMPFALFTQQFRHLKLKPAKLSLRAYDGALLKTVGQAQVKVTLNKQTVSTYLHVVDTQGPASFGRDLLQKLRIDWSNIHEV